MQVDGSHKCICRKITIGLNYGPWRRRRNSTVKNSTALCLCLAVFQRNGGQGELQLPTRSKETWNLLLDDNRQFLTLKQNKLVCIYTNFLFPLVFLITSKQKLSVHFDKEPSFIPAGLKSSATKATGVNKAQTSVRAAVACSG